MQAEDINSTNKIISNVATSNGRNANTAVEEAINNIIKIEGYATYTIHKKNASTAGDSFLGVLYEVDIKGETNEGENEIHLFVKIINLDQPATFVDVTSAYQSELYLYKELSEVYSSLQEEFNVPLEDRYEIVKFYDGGTPEVIALENMRYLGFRTHHRSEPASIDYIELCLKQLAKFYALSFVLEHERPTYFETKIKPLKMPINFDDSWNNFSLTLVNMGMKLLNEETKVKMNGFIKDITAKYKMHLEDENTTRCLCHGDFRPGNILMKKIDGKVLKVIPIDYQTILYSSPVTDFLFLIYSCTDREFRRIYLPYLKDLYHDTFGKFLNKFNQRVEKMFSREEFDRSFEQKQDYGFIIALIITPLLMSPKDSDSDVLAAPEKVHEVNDACKKRLLELIEEFTDLGYL